MEQSVGRLRMIGDSIEMALQRHRWSRTTGTLEHCHSLLGRWVQWLWRGCALDHKASEDWRARLLCWERQQPKISRAGAFWTDWRRWQL